MNNGCPYLNPYTFLSKTPSENNFMKLLIHKKYSSNLERRLEKKLYDSLQNGISPGGDVVKA